MEFQKNKFFRFVYSGIFLLTIGFALYSCSKDDGNVVYGPSTYAIDTTILRTDTTGRILGGDVSDWCFSSSASFGYGPAYPNPADDSVTVLFQLPQKDTLSMYFYDNNDSVFVFRNVECSPGYYAIKFKGSTYGIYNKIKRLYIRNKSGLPPVTSNCKNYGDIYFR